MIKVDNLLYVYKLNKKQMLQEKTKKNLKVAVNGVSFTAKNGEIFGLLGPNGAGKTTTLRCIVTLLKLKEGKIEVEGLDVKTQAEDVRRKIGFLTNELKLDTHFTPKYTMHYFGKLYGLTEDKINQRIDVLFNYFGIKEFENKKIEELSTGMKQKISIAVSLVHDPEVVIFDEPTNGLDIITAKAVTDYLKELKSQGKLIIISTHIMSLAAKLCDRIAIIIHGEKVAEGSVEEILRDTHTDDLEDAFFELYTTNLPKEATL